MPGITAEAMKRYLAAKLLKAGLENCRIGDFVDCHKREPVLQGGETSYLNEVASLTLEEWLLKLAHAALAAAEVIHPDVPAETPQSIALPDIAPARGEG